MKKLILLSTLSLAIATMSLPAVAQGQEVRSSERTAPRISSTTGLRDRHYISLYTGPQPLSSITLRPQNFMEIGENIQIIDESGQKIDANVSREGDRYRINFAQPVAADTKLELSMRNINVGFGPQMPAGQVFLYEVAGNHVGLQQEIPYGLAQVRVY